MKSNSRKIQMTVRLEPAVFEAAKHAARMTRTAQSIVVANAVKEVLLPAPHESPETQMKNLSIRVLTRMGRLERNIGKELCIIKELLALLARTYLNHTPAVPESERESASLSGRGRFAQLVERLNQNSNDGITILEQEPRDVEQ